MWSFIAIQSIGQCATMGDTTKITLKPYPYIPSKASKYVIPLRRIKPILDNSNVVSLLTDSAIMRILSLEYFFNRLILLPWTNAVPAKEFWSESLTILKMPSYAMWHRDCRIPVVKRGIVNSVTVSAERLAPAMAGYALLKFTMGRLMLYGQCRLWSSNIVPAYLDIGLE
jgi:hypothetical protein